MKKQFSLLVASCLGAGFLKGRFHIGGGTWGSLAGLLLCCALLDIFRVTVIGWLFVIAVILAVGVLCIPTAEQFLGPRKNWRGKTVKHDQSEIVIDEVWGMLIAVMPFLWINFSNRWVAMGLAFGLFRIFDVLKIWPVRLFDRWESPWGVMLDDGAAAIYAATSISLIYTWFPF